jgi:hypothetical protein
MRCVGDTLSGVDMMNPLLLMVSTTSPNETVGGL